MVEFAGWELPVYYSGIVKEHFAVCHKSGIFDVSHLGRLEITGPDAQSLIQYITTNDVTTMVNGGIQYSLVCQEDGGILDDILVYQYPNHYLLVVNAVNTETVLQVLNKNIQNRNVQIKNITDDTCMIAVQGPKAIDIIEKQFSTKLHYLSKYYFTVLKDLTLSRTGYTGEDGFEIMVVNSEAGKIWNQLLEIGTMYGLIPCGLGARDTLRLEAGNCLYGHEMDQTTNPYEAGLGFVVKLNKSDFIGKSALLEIQKNPLKKKLVGLDMCDNSIPRGDCPIQKTNQLVGKVTSGTYSPIHKKGIAMGYLPLDLSKKGMEVDILIRDKPHLAKVVQKKWR